MKKTLKLFIYILLGITLVLGGLILALETSSQRLLSNQEPPRAQAYLACDPTLNPPDQDKITFLTALGEKYREGISITRDDLDQALILVPAGDMVGLNGVYCNGMIFISDRLKQGARYYVARHELEHVFQAQGLSGDCGDQESCAHWTAAREYPLGLIQTVVSSLVGAYRLSPSLWTFLVNNWVMFKCYFLGLG